MLEESFTIRYSEISPEGYLPVWVLQGYLMESASADAHNLSFGMEEFAKDGINWVVARLQLNILKRVTSRQTLKIKTWHCRSDKFQSIREFLVYDEQGIKVASGVSWWLIIDLTTRKIVRIPQSLIDANGKTPPSQTEAKVYRNPSFEGQNPLYQTTVIARREDIDTNSHVNNMHFTAWALEALPQEFCKGKELKGLFVNFKNEMLVGDIVEVSVYSEGENVFWHILKRKSDGKEVSSIRTQWV